MRLEIRISPQQWGLVRPLAPQLGRAGQPQGQAEPTPIPVGFLSDHCRSTLLCSISPSTHPSIHPSIHPPSLQRDYFHYLSPSASLAYKPSPIAFPIALTTFKIACAYYLGLPRYGIRNHGTLHFTSVLSRYSALSCLETGNWGQNCTAQDNGRIPGCCENLQDIAIMLSQPRRMLPQR